MKKPAFLRRPASLVRDGAGLAGCALVSTGAGMIYLPAGFITGGLILVAGALLGAKRAG